ncbi:MAG TPA: hypothetical protein VGG37_00210 [Opitutaceae bacterium]|jgi:hypothetical protein
MNLRILACLGAAALLAPQAGAVDKVPEYGVTDTYVTSPTMLVRAGADGCLREIWAGMDARRMRHVPLFIETSIFGEVKSGGAWRDLRSLGYRHEGTRPGYIRMVSSDGLVSIEVTSRRDVPASPIFVTYHFAKPEEMRLTARFKYPQFITGGRADDGNGSGEFTAKWRGENAVLTTVDGGPALDLATEPAGRTVSIGRDGLVKDLGTVSEVVLCIDAAESGLAHPAAGSYVGDWRARLGSLAQDHRAELARRISVRTGIDKLDRLFSMSIDAVETDQFASGDEMGDLFFYRDSWLRDGTYTMIGLSLAGQYAPVERYFAFWDSQRDFSVGGEREAQQPAIGITGMWLYSRVSPKGRAFLEGCWPYVKFYADYYSGRVAREGMLRLAEEWICFLPAPSTWPNAEVHSGLRASAKIAAELGHADEAARWNAAADRLRQAFSDAAYDPGKGRIIPMAGRPGESFTDPEYPRAESRNGPLRDDRTDSGMLIIPRLEVFGRNQGIIAVDDPRFASTKLEVMRDLENPDHAIFRFGPNPSSPHAPQGELDCWPINTAWAAQDEWLLGRTDLGWRYILSGIVNKRFYDMDASHGYLPENWDRKGFADKPLIVWSHGDFLTSTLVLLLGVDLEPDGADIGLAPSLPPGSDHAEVRRFRFRDWRIDLDLDRRGGQVGVRATASGPGSLRVRLPFGRVLDLAPGVPAAFTVDPSQYFRAFGRDRNGAERARITSKVLLGRDPERDPRSMTPAEQEALMTSIETNYTPANQ